MNTRLLLGIGAAVVIVVILVIWPIHLADGVRVLLRSVESAGAWGPVFFVITYTISCVAFVPGSLLTLGAGVVFGVIPGTVYVSIGSTFGATAAFVLGRFVARERIKRKIANHARLIAIDERLAPRDGRS